MAKSRWAFGGIPLVLALMAGVAVAAGQRRQQTFAPHEVDHTPGPPPIEWETPELSGRSQDFESAEERKLRRSSTDTKPRE